MGNNGTSQQSLLSSLEFIVKERRAVSSHSSFRRKRPAQIQIILKNRRRTSMLTKRRTRLERPHSSAEGKVRTLRKLVPNCESMGVERLFTETADYILDLKMRVRVMQMLVGVLSVGSDDF